MRSQEDLQVVITHLNIQIPNVIEQLGVVCGRVTQGLLQNGVAIICWLSVNQSSMKIVVERAVKIPKLLAMSIQNNRSLDGRSPYRLILEDVGEGNGQRT